MLELSKNLMFDFHYRKMKKNFPGIELCFTDTDSFLYHITCDNFKEKFMAMKEHFDTSNYPTTSELFSLDNKAVLGKFKNETKGVEISEFIGLRSKMYSILLADKSEKNATAGVRRCVAKRYLRHAEFWRAVKSRGDYEFRVNQTTIQSRGHVLQTVTQDRRALSRFDDKRFILPDGETTRALGHYRNSMS